MSKITHRVEINYLSKEYDDKALFTSSPYRDITEAVTAYNEALALKCVDKKNKPVRVDLLEYKSDGLYIIASNWRKIFVKC